VVYLLGAVEVLGGFQDALDDWRWVRSVDDDGDDLECTYSDTLWTNSLAALVLVDEGGDDPPHLVL